MRKLIIAATLLASASAHAQGFTGDEGRYWNYMEIPTEVPSYQPDSYWLPRNGIDHTTRQQMNRYCRETYMQRGGSRAGSFSACPN